MADAGDAEFSGCTRQPKVERKFNWLEGNWTRESIAARGQEASSAAVHRPAKNSKNIHGKAEESLGAEIQAAVLGAENQADEEEQKFEEEPILSWENFNPGLALLKEWKALGRVGPVLIDLLDEAEAPVARADESDDGHVSVSDADRLTDLDSVSVSSGP